MILTIIILGIFTITLSWFDVENQLNKEYADKGVFGIIDKMNTKDMIKENYIKINLLAIIGLLIGISTWYGISYLVVWLLNNYAGIEISEPHTIAKMFIIIMQSFGIIKFFYKQLTK